jgi:hypothetical protein
MPTNGNRPGKGAAYSVGEFSQNAAEVTCQPTPTQVRHCRSGGDRPPIDLIGRKFGRWTVLAIHPKRVRYGRHGQAVSVLWRCRCDCGTERLVFGCNLRHGLSKSCGCLKREKTRQRNTKHGHACKGKVSRAYTRWLSMLQRCFDPNHAGYRYYGARGITVCHRWFKFENFYADMGDPPPGLSIDRIDVNGNYEPGNCRWATASEQVRNQRPRKRKGRRANIAEIQAFAASLARRASAPGGVRADLRSRAPATADLRAAARG